MAKKSTPIEDVVQEEQVLSTVEETVVEETVPVSTGYPSRDFYSPIPGVSQGKAARKILVEKAPAQDGGQEEA